MATPIEQTEKGYRLNPRLIPAGNSVVMTVNRVSDRRESQHGDYLFAEVTCNGETQNVLVSGTYNAPGFHKEGPNEGEPRKLIEMFEEVELGNPVKLIHFQDVAKGSGRTFSTFWLGTPAEKEGGGGGGITWARTAEDDTEAQEATTDA